MGIMENEMETTMILNLRLIGIVIEIPVITVTGDSCTVLKVRFETSKFLQAR